MPSAPRLDTGGPAGLGRQVPGLPRAGAGPRRLARLATGRGPPHRAGVRGRRDVRRHGALTPTAAGPDRTRPDRKHPTPRASLWRSAFLEWGGAASVRRGRPGPPGVAPLPPLRRLIDGTETAKRA